MTTIITALWIYLLIIWICIGILNSIYTEKRQTKCHIQSSVFQPNTFTETRAHSSISFGILVVFSFGIINNSFSWRSNTVNRNFMLTPNTVNELLLLVCFVLFFWYQNFDLVCLFVWFSEGSRRGSKEGRETVILQITLWPKWKFAFKVRRVNHFKYLKKEVKKRRRRTTKTTHSRWYIFLLTITDLLLFNWVEQL